MPPRIPRATYRIQLSKDFTFDDAAALVPYLARLGVSHLYASPFLKARAGSAHGYDIVDHNQLNPELGGEEGFTRLSQALADADLGLILDFVPNHMGVGLHDNPWWLDVLEWGPRSPYARFFDIAWSSLPFKKGGGVLLPILGASYGEALESGDLALRYDAQAGSFSVWYFQYRLPVRPDLYGDIIRNAVAAADAAATPVGAALLALADTHRRPRGPERRDAPAFKRAVASVPGGAEIIARGLSAYDARAGAAAALALHRLLERQHYRVAHWRVAASEINYRRFFDVNDLAGLRMEDMRTFTATHVLVMRLIAEGRLHGLRIDHIDGLRDPHQYMQRLQRMIRRVKELTGGRKAARRPGNFYVLVEKILEEGERDPAFPGIAGTTGYEWLNLLSHVLLCEAGMPALAHAEGEFVGREESFEQVLVKSKERVLDTILISEFTVLARLLARIAAGHWSTRDFTSDRLQAALRAYVIHLPVYRTYATGEGIEPADRAIVAAAIAAARAQWQGPDRQILDFLFDVLSLDIVASERRGFSRARVMEFAQKVQQFTGPLMAKSLEDTTFYRWHVLLALNEVGGLPIAYRLTIAEFHAAMRMRAAQSPHGLTASATHDTKRGEDARARLLALTEVPAEWSDRVRRWRGLNTAHVVTAGDRRSPSPGDEYMLYQALLGAWPLAGGEDLTARLAAYAVKAAREAKLETNWVDPNPAYEEGLTCFVEAILDPQRSAGFLRDFGAFAGRIARLGALNSLTQVALKLTMPGVPDFYQGTEFWDLSLVDPDNRRPVDFAVRAAALAGLSPHPEWGALSRDWQSGAIKLALMQKLLALRRSLPELFAEGDYHALPVSGPDADHVIAFERQHGAARVLVVAGRHFGECTKGGSDWCAGAAWDAELGADMRGRWENVLDGTIMADLERVAVASLLGVLPVAVLRRCA
ncbi:MAG: malto-oligosyltrehalose synthase [Variibacter sp.]|nr:malto-oligosyltrehalose synthase [Variibacter sp.]